MPSVAMLHEIDPREALREKVGDLDGIEVFGNDVLVAIYQRPTKTKSGLILADSTRGEDVHQGKVALVLKMGPTCFLDEDGARFRDISAGDWIVLRPSDGWRVTLNTMKGGSSRDDIVDCRIVSDVGIRARVAHPDLIY
jgi:co-chaperonin GroES (HSP10)